MKKAKAKKPQLDLGEIAARLMQAQADETEALQELADGLASFIAGDETSAASVKKLASAAHGKLTSLLAGEAGDAEQALAAAVRLVCLATSPEAEPTVAEEPAV